MRSFKSFGGKTWNILKNRPFALLHKLSLDKQFIDMKITNSDITAT